VLGCCQHVSWNGRGPYCGRQLDSPGIRIFTQSLYLLYTVKSRIHSGIEHTRIPQRKGSNIEWPPTELKIEDFRVKGSVSSSQAVQPRTIFPKCNQSLVHDPDPLCYTVHNPRIWQRLGATSFPACCFCTNRSCSSANVSSTVVLPLPQVMCMVKTCRDTKVQPSKTGALADHVVQHYHL
jgi:hypothetical protein